VIAHVVGYFLALAAAHVAGRLGWLLGAALMWRLDFHIGLGLAIYSIRMSQGWPALFEHTFLALARATLAFPIARAVLSWFGLRLGPLFAVAIVALLLAWDLRALALARRAGLAYGDAVGEGGGWLYQHNLRLLPIGFTASAIVAWLYVRG